MRFFRALATGLGLGAIALFTPAWPTIAAEQIQFFVGPFEPTLWVDDLEAFAADGTITDRFQLFAQNLNESQRQELRRFLNQPLDVNLTSVSQFTYWQVGERFLDRMGQVVQTDSFLNDPRIRAVLPSTLPPACSLGKRGWPRSPCPPCLWRPRRTSSFRLSPSKLSPTAGWVPNSDIWP